MLCGIQLEFSNGVCTPLFETHDAVRKGLELIRVDVADRPIRKVSLNVVRGELINGLRIFDCEDRMIVNIVGKSASVLGSWQSKSIPAGLQIIGVKCSSRQARDSIPRVGFLLWNQQKSIIY